MKIAYLLFGLFLNTSAFSAQSLNDFTRIINKNHDALGFYSQQPESLGINAWMGLKLRGDGNYRSDRGNVEFIFDPTEMYSQGERRQFQLVKTEVLSINQNFELSKPHEKRLNETAWRQVYRGAENNTLFVSLRTENANAKFANYYEVWTRQLYTDDRVSGPAFHVGYISAQPIPQSFFDYFLQNKVDSEQGKAVLQKEIQQGKLWTRIQVDLDDKGLRNYVLDSILGVGKDGVVLKANPEVEGDPIVAIKAFDMTSFPNVKDEYISREFSARISFKEGTYVKLLSSRPQEILGMKAIIMEYSSGITLRDLINCHTKLSQESLDKIIKQLSVVETFAKTGVMMEDFGAANVMMEYEGDLDSQDAEIHIKFIDFSNVTYDWRASNRVYGAYHSLLAELKTLVLISQ